MGEARNKLAKLSEEELQRIHALEQELGKILVAYDPHHTLATLSAEELKKLQAVEEELGVVLLAFHQPRE
jgi:hypothetical protein